MTYTVVWDDPAINVRAIIASREEFRQLLEALGKAEERLPPDPPKTAAEGAARASVTEKQP